MSDLTLLRMQPVLAEKPWGGRRLAEFGKTLPPRGAIGESWEVADLPAEAASTVAEPRTLVAAGPHAGKSLHRLIAEYGSDLLGNAEPTPDGDFPLLVKLLDAREHLSVQVHPDAAYVATHPDARLKTESWYVVAADPGAHLYLGLRPGVSLEELAPRVGSGSIVGLLNVVPATAGDFHHLPAGLVHALGAGVMVAEVQTPSDTTFRLYDWDDRYDRPRRQMHWAEALEATRSELTSHRLSRPDAAGSRTLLTDEMYWMKEHRVGADPIVLDPRAEVRVIMVIAGSATVAGDEAPLGSTLVVPAAVVQDVEATASPGSILLEIGLA